jgi:ATP-dependent helicase HepA
LVGAWRSAHPGATGRHLAVARWIAQAAADNPERKFLVFAQDVDSVEAFAAALHMVKPQLASRKFHHRLSEDQLDDAALAFTAGPIRVLVSDDLGGEGRNFQNAWAVVHLDSPVSAGRVEQRIGRVDRLGRRADDQVRSVSVTGPLEVEQFLHRVHHEVFEVFTGSIGGLEFVLPGLVHQVRCALTAGREAMAEVVPAIEREVRAVRAEEDRAFDAGLDTTEAELRRAQEVAETLSEELLAAQRMAPMHWLRTLGVTVDSDHPNQTSSVRLEPANLEVSSLPGVGRGLPTFHGTWSRASALRREECQFLAPGHRLVDGALVALEQSLVGRWGCLARALPGAAPGSMFALGLFVMELVTGDTDLPPGLVARARAEVGRNVTVVHFARDANDGTWGALDGPPRLLEALDVPIFRHDAGDRNLTAEVPLPAKRGAWIESLGALVPALASAQARIKDAEAAVIEDGLKRVKKAWRGETAYYKLIRDEGSSSERPRAIEELRFRRQLEDAVAAMEPRLDAVLLVWSK